MQIYVNNENYTPMIILRKIHPSLFHDLKARPGRIKRRDAGAAIDTRLTISYACSHHSQPQCKITPKEESCQIKIPEKKASTPAVAAAQVHPDPGSGRRRPSANGRAHPGARSLPRAQAVHARLVVRVHRVHRAGNGLCPGPAEAESEAARSARAPLFSSSRC